MESNDVLEREPAKPIRVRFARRITTVYDLSGMEKLPGVLRRALCTLRVLLAALIIQSARGHIRTLVVLNGALFAVVAVGHITIIRIRLVYFERLSALVFGCELSGLMLSLIGGLAVFARSTGILALFVAIAYAMALAFFGFSITIASIAIAAFVNDERYQMGARVVCSVSLVVALLCALTAFVWARAAYDAQLTRVQVLLGGGGNGGNSGNGGNGNGGGSGDGNGGGGGGRSGGDDGKVVQRPPTASAARKPPPPPLAPLALPSSRGEVKRRRVSFTSLKDDDAQPVLRARLFPLLIGLPLFVTGCLLLFPLVFADGAACDVELLLVGARDLVGSAHVAWEGAMGEVFADENLRPVVRTLAVPRAALSVAPFRGVPMLHTLARWRSLGLLRPRGADTTQVVMFVLGRTYSEPLPAPPPLPHPPPSPPGYATPVVQPRCRDEPRYGSAWCQLRIYRCGRATFDARCAETCGLCAPRPPPASTGATSRVGTDVRSIGRSADGCVRALLQLDRLGLSGSRRLAALGYDLDAVRRIVQTRTRGGDPADAPRAVALADFEVICFRAADLQSDAFWASARAALGAALDEPPCGATAGVVGGMGPLSGAVYQQRLIALLDRIDTAVSLHAAATAAALAASNASDADEWTRGSVVGAAAGAAREWFEPTAAEVTLVRESPRLAAEVSRACVEMYSNPQLAFDARALLATVSASERMLVEQRTFLGRPDLDTLAGPSNAWYELSYRLLTRAWSISLGPGTGEPRLINMIEATVAVALPKPNTREGARMGFIATSTTLNGIEQREHLTAFGSNLYRLAWEARNAQLQREEPKHVYVELLPVNALHNGSYLERVEQQAIDNVKGNDISLAREGFADLLKHFKRAQNVRAVIGGCTEVSVAFSKGEVSKAYDLELFDSSLILAQAQFEQILVAVRRRVEGDR